MSKGNFSAHPVFDAVRFLKNKTKQKNAQFRLTIIIKDLFVDVFCLLINTQVLHFYYCYNPLFQKFNFTWFFCSFKTQKNIFYYRDVHRLANFTTQSDLILSSVNFKSTSYSQIFKIHSLQIEPSLASLSLKKKKKTVAKYPIQCKFSG